MTINLAIGYTTPPYGANLFTASAVAREPVESIIKNVWPFLLAMIFAMIILTFFPFFTMILPSTMF